MLLFMMLPSYVYGSGWDEYERSLYFTKFRAGYGNVFMADSDLDRNYQQGFGVFADLFLNNHRFRKFHCWNSLDIYTRLAFRRFAVTEEEAIERGMYKDSRIDILSLDLGLRYSIGKFFINQLFHFYILAAPRVVSLSENAVDDDNRNVGKTYYAVGAAGGAGFEFSVFTVTGLFVEYNYGYVPIGSDKSNIEGHQFFAGIIYRSKSVL